MTTEELLLLLNERIDYLLSRPFFVSKQDKKLLRMLQQHIITLTQEQLINLLKLYHEQD